VRRSQRDAGNDPVRMRMKLMTGVGLVSALAFWNQSAAGQPPVSSVKLGTIRWSVRVGDTAAAFLLVRADFNPPVSDSLRLHFAYLDHRSNDPQSLCDRADDGGDTLDTMFSMNRSRKNGACPAK
jgi:hypothetical protein